MADLLDQQRENWGTRTGFILAAIGSAVGLGNLWGFPYKVYSYGGGAFLVPYVVAMLAIGIPLLILEFSLGHMTQQAAPHAYRSINRKTEAIGWWGIILGFIIVTYYPVILAWCGSYLVECVKGIFRHGGELAWKGQGLDGVKDHFNRYLNSWSEAELAGGTRAWSFGGLVNPVVISLAVVWAAMYLCIFRGVRMVSKVVLLTVPLPWIMLFILTVRGLTLPGAAEGLNFYLDPKWSELAKPDPWRWGFGQMFFSMSLAFGVMVTYASFLHRKSDITTNAAIVGLADVGTSFVAGIAVFATLGAMAFATGGASTVQNVAKGGPGLVFEAFPYALAQLPYSAWFGAVFFIALLTLGIDSAFSITESVLASLVDKMRWNRDRTLIVMTAAGFGLGLVYCTRGGMDWLGSVDSFIINPWGGIVLLGLLECVVVGWAYRIKRLREHANERSDWRLGCWWDILIRYVAPLLLSGLFTWSILEEAAEPGGFLYKNGVLVIPAVVGVILALGSPLLALILSCIRSGGADIHAQHVGQPRTGRGAGLIGTLLVLGGIAAVGWSFYLSLLDQWAGRPIARYALACPITGYEFPAAGVAAVAGGVLALAALLIGAGMVNFAERNDRRPSGFARFSAGGGVMTLGGAGGMVLALLILIQKAAISPVKNQASADQLAGQQAAQKIAEHLTGPSYIVLSVMSALLVIGLGWCFYRAIKAAGAGPEERQVSEGSQEN